MDLLIKMAIQSLSVAFTATPVAALALTPPPARQPQMCVRALTPCARTLSPASFDDGPCALLSQVEKNKLGLRIFQMMQSLENEDYLDFGEFMKALGTFCMLGCVLLSAELGVGW